MKLREIMTAPVLTFTQAQPASDVLARMKDAGVRHGVVLSGSDVVGIVSERDLGGPRGGVVRKGATVADLMRAEPVLESPEISVIRAASLLRRRHIGCLPLMERGELVGIVTRGDVLEALATRRRRDRTRIPAVGIEAPRAPVVVSPNRDKRL